MLLKKTFFVIALRCFSKRKNVCQLFFCKKSKFLCTYKKIVGKYFCFVFALKKKDCFDTANYAYKK